MKWTLYYVNLDSQHHCKNHVVIRFKQIMKTQGNTHDLRLYAKLCATILCKNENEYPTHYLIESLSKIAMYYTNPSS